MLDAVRVRSRKIARRGHVGLSDQLAPLHRYRCFGERIDRQIFVVRKICKLEVHLHGVVFVLPLRIEVGVPVRRVGERRLLGQRSVRIPAGKVITFARRRGRLADFALFRLDHDLIDVFLDVDARDIFEITDTNVNVCGKCYGGEVVYTGPLDELFDLDLGALPYRTLDMVFETLPQDRFQPVGTVNYTTSEAFTRITEFKNMTGQEAPGRTTIMREYSRDYVPLSGDTPYYAIIEDENLELYRRYRSRVDDLVNFHCVGRLAEYRYYDMDGVVASALDLSDEIISQHS